MHRMKCTRLVPSLAVHHFPCTSPRPSQHFSAVSLRRRRAARPFANLPPHGDRKRPAMSVRSSHESAESVDLEEEPLVKKEETEEKVNEPLLPSKRVKFALCASHALSTWSDRTWSFAVGLIFIDIYKSSLFYVSLFGLVQALTSVLLSPSIGVFIDKTPRFKAVCTFYFVQNIGLVLAAMASMLLLWRHAHPSGPIGTLASLAIVAFGTMSSIGTMGGTIAIEKDWTKALVGTQSQELAKLNSTLKTIDLVCLIVAPIFSGVLMNVLSLKVAVIEIFLYNLVAWFPEVALVRYVTNNAPQLAKPESAIKDDIMDAEPFGKRVANYGHSLLEGFQLYFKQSCVLATLSLSILHLTVLSFGILMTAYVKWLGLSEVLLSLYRGLGALTGVLGARFFPFFHARFSLRTTGYLSNSFFLCCILLGALPSIANLIVPLSQTVRFNFLVWAIAISRFGLWLFDLSVTQILQEWVAEGQLGRVCATQRLLESVFTLLIFTGGMAASRPEQFVWLMIISVGAVITSFVLFSLFLMKSRYVSLTEAQEIEMVTDDDV